MSRARNTKDYLWTMTDIAKELGHEKGENIRKKFERVMRDKLGFSEDEIVWYRGDKKRGQFVFADKTKKETPCRLERVFEIVKNEPVSIKEKDELIECLCELLPVYRDKNDYKDIFKTHKKGLDMEEILSRKDRASERYYEIGNIIERYYGRTRGNEKMSDKSFVEIKSEEISKKMERSLYQYQYDLIEAWAIKWYFVIKEIAAVRIAERFEIVYESDVQLSVQGRSDFCEKGKITNEVLEEIYESANRMNEKDLCMSMVELYEEKKEAGDKFESILQELGLDKQSKKRVNTKTTCFQEWEKFVRLIAGNHISEEVDVDKSVCYVSLKEISEEDCYCVNLMAFEELEYIGKMIRKRKYEEIYCTVLKNRSGDDIEKLWDARRRISKKIKTVMDLHPL